MTYVVKTQPGCARSAEVLALLAQTGEQVIEQKHETPLARGAFFNAGFKTFPQVFHRGDCIGGLDELRSYLAGKRRVPGGHRTK